MVRRCKRGGRRSFYKARKVGHWNQEHQEHQLNGTERNTDPLSQPYSFTAL